MSDEADLGADELCRVAGRTVTALYRRGDRTAKAVDAAHGRIVRRTGLRGRITETDPDVQIILRAAARLGMA